MIPGSDRIPGRRNTAESANKNPLDTRLASSAKVLLFSAFNIAKETLFIDLNFGEDGDCEENGFRTVVTG